MREKEGLSYGIQTWLAPSSFEENSQLNLYAIFAPQNRGAAPQGDRRGARARAEGRLHRGRTRRREALAAAGAAHRARAGRDRSPAASCSRRTSAARGTTRQKIDAGIAAATLEQVNAVLRKYVDAARLRVFVRRRFREGEAHGGAAIAVAPPALRGRYTIAA